MAIIELIELILPQITSLLLDIRTISGSGDSIAKILQKISEKFLPICYVFKVFLCNENISPKKAALVSNIKMEILISITSIMAERR